MASGADSSDGTGLGAHAQSAREEVALPQPGRLSSAGEALQPHLPWEGKPHLQEFAFRQVQHPVSAMAKVDGTSPAPSSPTSAAGASLPVTPRSRMPSRRTSAGGSTEKVRYDILTLRHWFDSMDADRSGEVTELEWFNFLRNNPRLRRVFRVGEGELPPSIKDRFSGEARELLKREARELRRVKKVIRELDSDKNGTLQFEEFVEFFRRSGYLQEYESDDPPKARLAAIMSIMKSSPGEVDETLVEEFEHLCKWNLQGERRRALEAHVLQHVGPQSPAGARIQRRCLPTSTESSLLQPCDTPRAHRRGNDFLAVGSRMMGSA
mmetsp:Transcript_120743/g.336924  ORF Transcript_120743/g.336924 Transcript_120743/m.336924 type:complete len:323 (+) Transcript_120743:70-1038(+)